MHFSHSKFTKRLLSFSINYLSRLNELKFNKMKTKKIESIINDEFS